jgi:hypothetical protein
MGDRRISTTSSAASTSPSSSSRIKASRSYSFSHNLTSHATTSEQSLYFIQSINMSGTYKPTGMHLFPAPVSHLAAWLIRLQSTAVSRRTVLLTSVSVPASSLRVRLIPMRLASRAVSPLVAAPNLPALPVVLPVATVVSIFICSSLKQSLTHITEFAGGKVDPVEAGRKGGQSSN